jgi:hypothetical protein
MRNQQTRKSNKLTNNQALPKINKCVSTATRNQHTREFNKLANHQTHRSGITFPTTGVNSKLQTAFSVRAGKVMNWHIFKWLKKTTDE